MVRFCPARKTHRGELLAVQRQSIDHQLPIEPLSRNRAPRDKMLTTMSCERSFSFVVLTEQSQLSRVIREPQVQVETQGEPWPASPSSALLRVPCAVLVYQGVENRRGRGERRQALRERPVRETGRYGFGAQICRSSDSRSVSICASVANPP